MNGTDRRPSLRIDGQLGLGRVCGGLLLRGGYTTVSARRPFLLRAYAPRRDRAGLFQRSGGL